ncbi:hypothetical protein AVEN_142612-1 [Araneus ventricosus]|uniref:Uncharacterized protein n=1 Tax=Araneus ventricosus TaxID=182803 RepID=A0A4Y2GBW5_ARAVE|nr:hypothetical protein AVEN_142612-1 [Araneus ventricosus]
MTRTTTELASSSLSFRTMCDLTCNRPTYKENLQWNRVLNLKPTGREAETLPLGHRGPKCVNEIVQNSNIQSFITLSDLVTEKKKNNH